MSAAVRLLSVLSLVAVSLAPGTPTLAADPREAPVATLPMRPADVELLGTWSGTIAVDDVAEPFDGGYIAIERAPGDRFGVTVGPEAEVRYTGTRLERTEHGLRFEVSLPGFETRLLAYDVEIHQGVMTGSVTFVKHRVTKPGHLEFAKRLR